MIKEEFFRPQLLQHRAQIQKHWQRLRAVAEQPSRRFERDNTEPAQPTEIDLQKQK